MLKRILALLVSLGFAAALLSCSSSEVENEEADVAAVEELAGEGDEFDEEAGDLDEGESLDGDEEESIADEDLEDDAEDTLDELESSEEVAEGDEELDEDGLDETDDELMDTDGEEQEVADGEEFIDEGAPSDESMTDELVEDGVVEEQAIADADDPLSEESAGLAGEEMDGMEELPVEEKKWIPVKKIADMPFEKNGVLVNTVYLARDGDTLDSVSEKIFGHSNREALLTPNPHLARGLKVGDKVYYNSPQRQGDSSKLLTFYEDAGLSPEVYVSQPGDNIRAIAKGILGHGSSWKEVWATNIDVESKGEIPAGTSLRYWAATNIAANPSPAAENILPPPIEEPMQDASNDIPPPPPSMDEIPPPPAQAMNDIPPPPPMDDIPPPPPVVASIEPPPPPPPPPPRPSKMMDKSEELSGSPLDELMEDREQMMLLGAGGILLMAGVLLFVLIRKKRGRKDIDFNTATHTQIE